MKLPDWKKWAYYTIIVSKVYILVKPTTLIAPVISNILAHQLHTSEIKFQSLLNLFFLVSKQADPALHLMSPNITYSVFRVHILASYHLNLHH